MRSRIKRRPQRRRCSSRGAELRIAAQWWIHFRHEVDPPLLVGRLDLPLLGAGIPRIMGRLRCEETGYSRALRPSVPPAIFLQRNKHSKTDVPFNEASEIAVRVP